MSRVRALKGYGTVTAPIEFTGSDFLVWQQQYGDSVLSVMAASANTAVPEPATLTLLVIYFLIDDGATRLGQFATGEFQGDGRLGENHRERLR